MDPESADRSTTADVVDRHLVDRQWTGDLRAAVFCALALLCLVTLIDCANRTFTPPRAALWTGLALLLYGVLHPPKVTAGHGRLSVRGLWRTHSVTTDLLISVRRAEGIAPRLILRDALGNQVTVDPTVLTTNPPALARGGDRRPRGPRGRPAAHRHGRDRRTRRPRRQGHGPRGLRGVGTHLRPFTQLATLG
ncbi:hypothetical protein ACIQNU_03095 [Streptomyces sp. NPDC091292]|uniref:hypothetical protein n=1 Tax=Streptomyces sp. NPDC091292 TaxID=3365991 RepID=UPI0038181C84